MDYEIAGHRYKVIRVDKIKKTSRDTEGAFGAVSVSQNIIAILNSMEKTRGEEILLHEILHTFDNEFGIGLSERQIEALTGSLFNQFGTILIPILDKILIGSEYIGGTYIVYD